MKTIHESVSTPKADGYRMPGEFEPQTRIWMAWPHRTDTWAWGAKPAQKQYADVARAIAEFEPVTMCVNQVDYANAKAVFEDDENVTVVEMTTDDAWVRDTGATWVVNDEGDKRAVHWHFNAYGGFENGLYFPWDKDEQIALKMAEMSGCRRYRPESFILEGGSIHVDGEGTVITTDMCLLDPGQVLCIWSDDPDYPFYNECHAAYETLSNAVDAKGRKLEVTKLCMPVKPLYMDQASCDSIDTEEYAAPRRNGQPP